MTTGGVFAIFLAPRQLASFSGLIPFPKWLEAPLAMKPWNPAAPCGIIDAPVEQTAFTPGSFSFA
jgi:hypothetical protein